MPNTTLTASIIAKEALTVLDNELGWLKRLHRGYDDEFTKSVNGYKVGDEISIRRPDDGQVRIGPVSAPTDVIEGKTTLKVDQYIGTDFKFTSSDLTLKIEDLSERVIKPRMINVINHLANDVLTQMYRGIPSWVGTPGQVINSYSDFAKGPKRLDIMAVPMMSRCAILSPDDHWDLLGSQTQLYITGAANDAYRNRDLGKIGNVDTYMTQVAPVHITGARGGSPVVNGANQNVTYEAVKDTWTQTLVVGGASNSIVGWAKAGDVFTMPGVFMVNPKTKQPLAELQQFVVMADADSSGAGAVSLTISPPIISAAGQPHRTVTAAPANAAALNFMGSAATGYTQNLMFHDKCMALVPVVLDKPPGAVDVARESYKGFSVRVIPYYDGTNDVSNWRLDMLYGRRLIDPRLATRISGTA